MERMKNLNNINDLDYLKNRERSQGMELKI